MELFKLLAVCILSYLLGSVTFATIVSKVIAGKDIRTLGNHNAGMSNMIVSVGAKPGIITFLGDFGKGVLSVLLAFMIFGFGETKIGVLAALCAMLGHLYPVFFRFSRGKGYGGHGRRHIGDSSVAFSGDNCSISHYFIYHKIHCAFNNCLFNYISRLDGI